MSPVSRPVTVAVAGTHSTGKSTFLARLAHELRRHDVQVATVADLGEEAQRAGFPILARHTWGSTLWIITRGISNELAAWHGADVLLVDRPVPDALGYYLAALAYRGEHPDPAVLAYLHDVASHHTDHAYDLIFRTSLDHTRPVGIDKPRDDDKHFRVLADHYVERTLHQLDVPHDTLTADGHPAALLRAVTFTTATLATRPGADGRNANDQAPGPWMPDGTDPVVTP